MRTFIRATCSASPSRTSSSRRRHGKTKRALEAPFFVRHARPALLDLGFLAQVLDKGLDLLLLHVVADLVAHLCQGRELRVAHVVELDDVPAELRLHGLFGEL